MSGGKKKLFTRAEVANHNDPAGNLFIIHDKVYDVGKFLNEHPGGEEILAEQRGKDGSEAFDDVGHSEDAREMMSTYLIGELVESERSKTVPKKIDWVAPKKTELAKNDSGLPYGLIVVAVIALFVAYNLGIFSS